MNGRPNLLYDEIRLSWIPFGSSDRETRAWRSCGPTITAPCRGSPAGRSRPCLDYVRRRVRRRYEVDTSEHRERLQLHLPAAGELDHFEVTVAIGFKVGDPVEIVKRNLGDVLTLMRDHLSSTLRPITRQFRIDNSRDAEVQVNRALVSAAFALRFEPAVIILSCWATVRPDNAYRGHVSAVGKAEQERVVTGINHSAKIDNHVRMVNALGSRRAQPPAADRLLPPAEPHRRGEGATAAAAARGGTAGPAGNPEQALGRAVQVHGG